MALSLSAVVLLILSSFGAASTNDDISSLFDRSVDIIPEIEHVRIITENENNSTEGDFRDNCTLSIYYGKCKSVSKSKEPDDTQWAYNAKSGTALCFKWKCDIDGYGMRVVNCTADSELGSAELLLNSDGCSPAKSPLFMDTPVYSKDLSEASATGLMFIYELSPYVRFRCSIDLCSLCQCENTTSMQLSIVFNQPPKECADYAGRTDIAGWNDAVRHDNSTYPLCPMPTSSLPEIWENNASVCHRATEYILFNVQLLTMLFLFRYLVPSPHCL